MFRRADEKWHFTVCDFTVTLVDDVELGFDLVFMLTSWHQALYIYASNYMVRPFFYIIGVHSRSIYTVAIRHDHCILKAVYHQLSLGALTSSSSSVIVILLI